MQGLHVLSQFWKQPIIGVPGTIDNKFFGSDVPIGINAVINTALDAIDKIHVIAGACSRNFIIKVMSRAAGFIALEIGVASDCDKVFIPQQTIDWNAVGIRLRSHSTQGEKNNLVILAEGADNVIGVHNASKKLEELTGKR